MDKEWDKYRVAFVIQGKPHYVEEDERTVNTKVCQNILPMSFRTCTLLTRSCFRNSEEFLFTVSRNRVVGLGLGWNILIRFES